MRIAATLWNLGPASTGLQAGAVGAVGLCIGLWIRAKTVDQSERGNAERRALFVGLWPPFLWMAGDTVRAFERGTSGMRGRRARK
jgi:hypothetical protein